MVYNIESSTLVFKYNEWQFYFSSELYYNNFVRDYKAFIIDEKYKAKLKYKVNIVCDVILMLLLYKKIEKRGFRVYCEGKRLKETYKTYIGFDESSFIN